MTGKNKYCAFISYRHTDPDKPVAIALQKQLERYRVPRYLIRQGYPRQLGLVFRDESDLPTSSDLGRQIESALDQSEKLIVICSPEAPHSKYVASEIEYFKKTKGDNHCLALLVKGEPSREKVFPDELTRQYHSDGAGGPAIEPIAADVRAKTLRASLRRLKTSKLKIVAGLIGCNYDDLVRRQRERRMRRIAVASAAAALFLVFFSLFMVRQFALVNESQRETQLAYSRQSLNGGDHVLAMEQALAAARKGGPLFSFEIPRDTKDSLYMASLIPAFSRYTRIPLRNSLENCSFTPDGKRVLVWSELSAREYDTRGKLLWEFDAEGKGDRISAVSPDGSRAVVVKADPGRKPPTTLSLWDTRSGECIRELMEGSGYSVQDVVQMNLLDVLQARFSPDGKYVCAYHAGGYFNENDTLQFWYAATGEPAAAIDAGLLGGREDGGQGRVVEDCRYYPDGTVRFKGSANYVYYRPDWAEPVTVPFRNPSDGDFACVSPDERFGLISGGQSPAVMDRASRNTVSIPLGEGESIDPAQVRFVGQGYAVVPVAAGTGDGKRWVAIETLDLTDMRLLGRCDFSAVGFGGLENMDILAQDCSDLVYIAGRNVTKTLMGTVIVERRSPVCALSLSGGDLALLAGDTGFLDDGTWKAERIGGGGADYLAFRQTDGNGGMKVLAVDPAAREIRNLYHIARGEEFEAQGAQADPGNTCLLVKSGASAQLYSLADQPAPCVRERCDVYAVGSAGAWAATFGAGALEVWNDGGMAGRKAVAGPVRDLCMSDDGKVLLGLMDGGAVVWDVPSLGERCSIGFGGGECGFAGLSPDGGRVALMIGPELRLYDSASGKLVGVLSDSADTQGPLNCWYAKAAFSPDGTTLACVVRYYPDGQDQYAKELRFWDCETGGEKGVIPTVYADGETARQYEATGRSDLPLSIDSVFYSADGSAVCAAYANALWIWNAATYETLATVQESGRPQNRPTADMKGNLLLYPVNGEVHVWDLKENRCVKYLTVEGGISDYAVSPEGRWLLGAGAEGAWLFDMASGVCAMKAVNEAIAHPAWSGGRLSYITLTGGQMNCVPYLYDTPAVTEKNWTDPIKN